MQKKRSVTHKKDTTLHIVETAMAEELKARDFYKKVSTQLEDKAARLKFDVMSDTEQRHYELLRKWYEDNYGQSPKTKEIKVAKIVKVKKPEKRATYEDIINIIINAEQKAYEFYEDAAKKTKDKEAKKLFDKLADMERAHVTQFKDEFRVITEPSLQCAEEDIPWMLEV